MFKEGQKVTISSEAGSFRETEHYIVKNQLLGSSTVWVCSKAPDDKPFRVHQKHLTLAEDNTVPTALAAMVAKLDARDKRNSRGYVTKRDELIDILSEVSKLVSVVIIEEERPYSVQHKEISVTIKLGLTLERDLL
jgi:hypothetical protein